MKHGIIAGFNLSALASRGTLQVFKENLSVNNVAGNNIKCFYDTFVAISPARGLSYGLIINHNHTQTILKKTPYCPLTTREESALAASSNALHVGKP